MAVRTQWILLLMTVLQSITRVAPQACNSAVPVVIHGMSGSLTSPGYPNNYAKNLDCLYNITVPAGYTIKLTFVDFNLQGKVNHRCLYSDFVQTYDAISATDSDPTDEICGGQLPGPVYSKTNWIKLRFHTDNANQFRGFNITFKAITEQDTCPSNKVITKTNGNITSPYYPRFFPARKTCMWKITAPKGTHVMVRVLEFDILDCGYSCNCGYLEVAVGESQSQKSQKFCQDGLNDDVDMRNPFYSIRNNIWLTFHSYNHSFTNHEGFLITFEQMDYTPPVCPDAPYNLTDSNGAFSSPNYPRQYPSNTNCYWLITVAANSRVKLNFTEMKLDGKISGYDKCFDWVKVYSGPTKASGLIEQFCEFSRPAPLVSSANQMLVEFLSDNTIGAKGFHAVYTTTNDAPSRTSKPAPTSNRPSSPSVHTEYTTTSDASSPTTKPASNSNRPSSPSGKVFSAKGTFTLEVALVILAKYFK